jgi:integrase
LPEGQVAATGRQPNAAYRIREHLTEHEMGQLLAALNRKRHGQRDWLIGLLIYRHGLRVSEACDLRWDDIDLPKRTIDVRRLKGSHDSRHGGGPPSRERPSPLPLARPLGLVENVKNGPDEGGQRRGQGMPQDPCAVLSLRERGVDGRQARQRDTAYLIRN